MVTFSYGTGKSMKEWWFTFKLISSLDESWGEWYKCDVSLPAKTIQDPRCLMLHQGALGIYLLSSFGTISFSSIAIREHHLFWTWPYRETFAPDQPRQRGRFHLTLKLFESRGPIASPSSCDPVFPSRISGDFWESGESHHRCSDGSASSRCLFDLS